MAKLFCDNKYIYIYIIMTNNLVIMAIVAAAIILFLHMSKQGNQMGTPEAYSSIGTYANRSFYPGAYQFDEPYRRGYIYPFADKEKHGYYAGVTNGASMRHGPFFEDTRADNVRYPYYTNYPVKLGCPCSL